MAKATAAVEPSMEEILASIRRIIADDGTAPVAMDLSPDGGDIVDLDAPIDEADIERLFNRSAESGPSAGRPVMTVVPDCPAPTDESAPSVASSTGHADEPIADVAGADVEQPFIDAGSADIPLLHDRKVGSAEMGEQDAEPSQRVGGGDSAARAAGAASGPRETAGPQPSAAHSPEPDPLVSETTGATVNAAFGQLTHTILSNNARTLDDIVKEMLRPMLKGWLDENLPVIVERLVRAEIERVSRGR
jgi:uncharacterized protein